MKHLCGLAALLLSLPTIAEPMPDLYSIGLKDIDGKELTLGKYKGDVLLIVNVASKCGLTPQYQGLQKLFSDYQEKGLKVLGFPCNDFGGQEPGSNQEIKAFCEGSYQVTFPMFDKLHVKGEEAASPLRGLTGEASPFPGAIRWNFGKFLVGRDGRVVARFAPRDKPDSEKLVQAVETALRKKE